MDPENRKPPRAGQEQSDRGFGAPAVRKATFVLTEEALLGLKIVAARERRNMAEIVDELIRKYLQGK